MRRIRRYELRGVGKKILFRNPSLITLLMKDIFCSLVVLSTTATALTTTTTNHVTRRRIASLSSALILVSGKKACAADTPWNPLGLKGQFWETGSMVYRKEEAVDVENPRDTLAEAISRLESARRDAEVGDMESASSAVRGLSERELRLVGSQLSSDNLEAQKAFSKAMGSYDELIRAASTLSSQQTPFLQETLGLLATSGIIFLFPPAVVNAALQRTPNKSDGSVFDTGLNFVAALVDCVDAFNAFVEKIP